MVEKKFCQKIVLNEEIATIQNAQNNKSQFSLYLLHVQDPPLVPQLLHERVELPEDVDDVGSVGARRLRDPEEVVQHLAQLGDVGVVVVGGHLGGGEGS